MVMTRADDRVAAAAAAKPFEWEALLSQGRMQTSLVRRAVRITLFYAAFAAIWIYLSDKMVGHFADDQAEMVDLNTYKGLAFVLVTSALLLVAILGVFGRLDRAYRGLEAHKAEVARFSRLFEALSEINHASLWATSRDDLFHRVCEALVRHGGFRMAWIGWESDPPGRLLPVAECGDRDGYLQKITVSTLDDDLGRGPSGTAFRTARPAVRNDVLGDSASGPWHAHMKEHGYLATAGFPVREGSEVKGVLSVYAGEVGFFHDREIELLARAAANLSYAIDRFRRKRLRELAEKQAHTERQLSQAMIEAMPGLVFLFDAKLRYLRWNRNTESITGYSSREMTTLSPLDFFEPAEQPRIQRRIAQALEQGEALVEANLRTREGRLLPYTLTGRRIEIDGQPCILGMGVPRIQRPAGAPDTGGGPAPA